MTPEEIRAEIESYPPVLTAGQLVKIAKQQGWQERDSNSGGHRILERDGFGHISIPYHGKGTERDRATTRMHLERIYQPAIAQAEESVAKQAEWRAFITELERILYDTEQRFRAESYRKLSQLEGRIQEYETQRLKECDRMIHQLLSEEQQAVLEQQQQQIEHLQARLKEVVQANIELNEQLQLQQQEIRAKDNEVQTTQQVAVEMRCKVFDLEHRLVEQQEQVALKIQELENARGSLAIYRRSHRQQRWVAIAALAIFGVILGIAFSTGIASLNWR